MEENIVDVIKNGDMESFKKINKINYDLACGLCAQYGQLDILVYIDSICECNAQFLEDDFNTLCGIAAINGHLHIIKWLTLNFDFEPDICDELVNRIIDTDNPKYYEILDWFMENNFKPTNSITDLYAYEGNIESLKKVIQNGCGWGPFVLFHAVEQQHYNIFKYSLENGCPWQNHLL